MSFSSGVSHVTSVPLAAFAEQQELDTGRVRPRVGSGRVSSYKFHSRPTLKALSTLICLASGRLYHPRLLWGRTMTLKVRAVAELIGEV